MHSIDIVLQSFIEIQSRRFQMETKQKFVRNTKHSYLIGMLQKDFFTLINEEKLTLRETYNEVIQEIRENYIVERLTEFTLNLFVDRTLYREFLQSEGIISLIQYYQSKTMDENILIGFIEQASAIIEIDACFQYIIQQNNVELRL